VPRDRIHVIPAGVDAEGEFDLRRVEPVPGLEEDALHVLYPGRLVAHEDPLLMVDVVERAAAELPQLRVHVVGDGPLEGPVRAAVEQRGLAPHVLLHPPTPTLAPWYAACDAVLMTSELDDVPVVICEAMAMALPIVAPALPGSAELLRGEGGTLVEPRDDAERYARALVELAADGARRRAIGARSRARALGELSVRTMARAHERLYDSLTGAGAERPAPAVAPQARLPAPAPAFLPPRRRTGTPLVSVIVPCFNDGRHLPECLGAIRAQTWPELEVIVVDDASTDARTAEVLAQLETAGDVRVLRMAHNGGPSRARNAGLDEADGGYLLAVEADNLLLPDAVERMLEQLRTAGPDVGYVYPSLQYFGNRRDLFEAPGFNLHELLWSNSCDTGSLFDATPFREGLRFAEDIVPGHEDWDLVLQLAARGIRGEPARRPTLLYRKSGFTRSDIVAYRNETFAETIRARHPELFGSPAGRAGWYTGPAASIKARWSDRKSVV